MIKVQDIINMSACQFSAMRIFLVERGVWTMEFKYKIYPQRWTSNKKSKKKLPKFHTNIWWRAYMSIHGNNKDKKQSYPATTRTSDHMSRETSIAILISKKSKCLNMQLHTFFFGKKFKKHFIYSIVLCFLFLFCYLKESVYIHINRIVSLEYAAIKFI